MYMVGGPFDQDFGLQVGVPIPEIDSLAIELFCLALMAKFFFHFKAQNEP
jgi:hypothetical protein